MLSIVFDGVVGQRVLKGKLEINAIKTIVRYCIIRQFIIVTIQQVDSMPSVVIGSIAGQVIEIAVTLETNSTTPGEIPIIARRVVGQRVIV